MEDVRALVEEILNDGYLLVLATIDADGPWTAPVVFVPDDALNLYWISLPETRHSRAIAHRPAVGGTIIASHKDQDERAVQISGTAEAVDDVPFALEMAFAQKRGEPIPERHGGVLSFDGKQYQWYKLTPSTFKLTYNRHFGYDNRLLAL